MAESVVALLNRLFTYSKKHTNETNTPKLSDDDGGYVSRSSSEDIEERQEISRFCIFTISPQLDFKILCLFLL